MAVFIGIIAYFKGVKHNCVHKQTPPTNIYIERVAICFNKHSLTDNNR